jgi:hypothetical protein
MAGIMMPYMSSIGQMGYIAPSSIPSLSLWYNASESSTLVNNVSTANFDVTVVNNTKIGKWVDLSGLGQPANVNGGNSSKPTYITPIQNSLGAISYTGSPVNLDINPATWSNSLSGFTLYVMARPTSLPATIFPLMVSNLSCGIWWNGTNWSIGQSVGNRGTVTVTDDTTKFHMYGMVFDGSQTGNANRLQFRYDRSAKTLTYTGTIGTTTGSNSYWFVGGNNRGSGAGGATFSTYMVGYIGEVLIWTRTLTAAELAQVELYLNTKWNLGY